MTTVKSQFIDWLHTNQFETQNLIDQYLRLINFSLYYQVGIFCVIHCFVDLILVWYYLVLLRSNITITKFRVRLPKKWGRIGEEKSLS